MPMPILPQAMTDAANVPNARPSENSTSRMSAASLIPCTLVKWLPDGVSLAYSSARVLCVSLRKLYDNPYTPEVYIMKQRYVLVRYRCVLVYKCTSLTYFCTLRRLLYVMGLSNWDQSSCEAVALKRFLWDNKHKGWLIHPLADVPAASGQAPIFKRRKHG